MQINTKPFKSSDDINIEVTGKEATCKEFVKFFKLNERYQWHAPEAFDIYKKHRIYQEFPKEFKGRYSLSEYALGFSEVDKENRFLGIFLTGILKTL